MSQEWSEVVSAEVKEEYMTLQVSSLFELDINASQAWFSFCFTPGFSG